MTPTLDFEGFCAALDSQRLAKIMTWKQVAEASGVSASTLSRMTQGKRPDADGFARLITWSGLSLSDFMRSETRGAPEALAGMTALLRADPKLSEVGRRALEAILKSTYEQLRIE